MRTLIVVLITSLFLCGLAVAEGTGDWEVPGDEGSPGPTTISEPTTPPATPPETTSVGTPSGELPATQADIQDVREELRASTQSTRRPSRPAPRAASSRVTVVREGYGEEWLTGLRKHLGAVWVQIASLWEGWKNHEERLASLEAWRKEQDSASAPAASQEATPTLVEPAPVPPVASEPAPSVTEVPVEPAPAVPSAEASGAPPIPTPAESGAPVDDMPAPHKPAPATPPAEPPAQTNSQMVFVTPPDLSNYVSREEFVEDRDALASQIEGVQSNVDRLQAEEAAQTERQAARDAAQDSRTQSLYACARGHAWWLAIIGVLALIAIIANIGHWWVATHRVCPMCRGAGCNCCTP